MLSLADGNDHFIFRTMGVWIISRLKMNQNAHFNFIYFLNNEECRILFHMY